MRYRTRGNPGEAAVLNALVRQDFPVLLPFGGGHPFDLVVAIDHEAFVRVQCKTAWPEGGCLIFNCLSTDHGRGPLSYEGLADIFGVYFPPTQDVYLVPIDAVAATEGRVRLEPTLNNQKRRIRRAEEYAIDQWSQARLLGYASKASSVP
jgi:hypothetical protein